jgi:hypothetical protein
MSVEYIPLNDRELYAKFKATGLPLPAFHCVLLPGYRLMGWEWAESCIRAWSVK